MKEVQDIRMLKLNIIYTMMLQNSYYEMPNLLENEVRLKRHKTGIEELIDCYFTTPFQEFYQLITEGDHYLPVYILDENKYKLLKDLAFRFLKHEGVNTIEEMKKYMNGRIVANILMGISTPSYTDLKYGQEPYFGEFRNIEYGEVLEKAKEACMEFLQCFVME